MRSKRDKKEKHKNVFAWQWKAGVENTAISQHPSVLSTLNGKESGFSCPPLDAVFLGAATYWHRVAYSGLLWGKRIVIFPQLTVSCSVHSVTKLAEVKQTFQDRSLKTQHCRVKTISLHRIIHSSTDVRCYESASRVDINPFFCFIFPCKKWNYIVFDSLKAKKYIH